MASRSPSPAAPPTARTPLSRVRLLAPTAILTLSLCAALPAQEPAADSSILTLDGLYASDEFEPEHPGEIRWLPDRPAYLKLEGDLLAVLPRLRHIWSDCPQRPDRDRPDGLRRG